jgi:hypothetical protein
MQQVYLDLHPEINHGDSGSSSGEKDSSKLSQIIEDSNE